MPGLNVPELLDVLPARTSGGCQVHESPLPAALARRLATLDDADALSLLVAALAWAEARLTGGDAVRIVVAGTPAVLDADRTLSAPAWRNRVHSCIRAGSANVRGEAWGTSMHGAVAPDEPCQAPVSRWQWQQAGEACLRVEYDAPLADTGAALLADVVVRAAGALLEADAATPLGAIDVLDAAQRRLQCETWNDTGRAPRHEGTVHDVLARVCSLHPDSVAAVDAREEVSHRELDARAAAVATSLLAAGVLPGDIVAVAMERSISALATLIGVLKAGAAYLPLDAAQPEARLGFVLDDAGVRVVLVDEMHAGLPLPPGVARVPIAPLLHAANPGGAIAFPQVDGNAIAYVMYTSGSTGSPKGVEVRHRSILRLVLDVDYIELGPMTRMLHAAPLGFDASTLEIWGPLLNGGRVVVHPEAVPSGRGLETAIARHGIDCAWLTAALFNAIVDEDPVRLAGLRTLFTGGEALSVDHVRRMQRAAPGLALHNGYGPTECTTFTTTWRIPDGLPEGTTSIPIGRPISLTRVHVLNGRHELLPTGAIGTLFVAGDGLARGYLGRDDLTVERFVPDPFGAPGERMYDTGDRVRWRGDGTLDFVGRGDDQVKVRGFRIEPGEIEVAIARHPAVSACVVVARRDGAGEPRLVAYLVGAAQGVSVPELRAHLGTCLPDFMVPSRYVVLEALPVTANGKLDRRALPAPGRERPELSVGYEPGRDQREALLCAAFADVLDLEQVGRHDHFFELGGSSLSAARLAEAVGKITPDTPVPTTTVFAHPTPASLAAFLARGASGRLDATRMARAGRAREAVVDDSIAIVAMAGRFPGAGSVEAFWDNLLAGRETIRYFAAAELDPAIPSDERSHPDYVAARGVVDDIDQFDAAFFGIGAREAELMDPQQRLLLELCWECMERAGHAPGTTSAPVGIFAGMYNATYYRRHVAMHPDLVDKVGAFQVMLGNEKDYIATRVAHKLDLTGPAISVHTGCSTSLVAICEAVDSLRAGRCDMALAGGVSLTCPPNSGYLYQEGAMLSPDGHTRTFDAGAQGTVFSDGAAVVLLRRLSDALADGDEVVAIIRGCATNNDGADKASFTAPSSAGQAAVIAMAHDDAGVDARSISYVEAHGTATPLGDPIEIEGLTRAFRRSTQDVGFCHIGSVKSNVGHMVIAAGAGGLIKTALALRTQRIPASLHFTGANPAIGLDASPFVVNAEQVEWPQGSGPRRAGVSSFGVGGTNAHVVMEQAPTRPASTGMAGPHLLVLSARSPQALGRAAADLADHLARAPSCNLADVAWTLGAGRKAFAHRAAIVASDAADAVSRLRGTELATAVRARPARHGDVVFLFPGQGAQYAGMGRALHASEPAFQHAFDHCADIVGDAAGLDLRSLVFGDDPAALLPTSVMQPATFAIEYALARLWMALGVQPVAMVGHSVGEFVAATLAGVFELPAALQLVVRRGALMQAQPAGGMLSIRASFDAIARQLPAALSMAAENAPGSCVVAGPHDAIAAFQSALDGQGIACRELRTSHAFHSAMMDDVVAPFRRDVAAITRNAPRLPIASTVDGRWLDGNSATSADYWAQHLRMPVRFASALDLVLGESSRILLEVGPRTTLTTLARQHPAVQARGAGAVASLADAPDAELASLRMAAGQLWCRGAALEPTVFDRREQRRRLQLPTYPFEKQRYWVEASAPRATVLTHPTAVASTAVDAQVGAAASSLSTAPVVHMDRKPRLVSQLKAVFEDVAGFDLADADGGTNFIELGLDSLMLTQVALQVQKTFATRITFRQLMGECATLDRLAEHLDGAIPADAPSTVARPVAVAEVATPASAAAALARPASGDVDYVRQLIDQQLQLMSRQLALLDASAQVAGGLPAALPMVDAPNVPAKPGGAGAGPTEATRSGVAAASGLAEDEAAIVHTRYDVKKAFGAIARIDTVSGTALDARQRRLLDAFIERYVQRTARSKAYTQANRAHMADPRVVTGFKPLLKEMIYQIVIERSRGAHLWDLDGNEYVDALNGFGMSLFGWQPGFVLDAVRRQLELGYEIGPQHPLAGEVARLICEITGHDRAALCNTGSEAVLGALRIARTVTGRETVVLFSGAYHGIIDEMIVRGTKALRAVPAAPGILRNTAEHVLVLDYGTEESLRIIRERAHEIAAVLVEPVQSRRPDFQPTGFLQALRDVTSATGALLVFDEVVTGFRAHPGGAQALFGIQADIATYGKVVGGGYPIGVIAGRRACMDALDGGHWQYGDDSTPSVGVTYFAGTFVRHPLALAAAKAVLEHVRDAGPELQATLNGRVDAMVQELNAFCADQGAPIAVKHFASVWKTQFLEDHPMQDLLFAMMRSRGIHILDNFPCFLTTAHTEDDFRAIIDAFQASVRELQDAGFLPRRAVTPRTAMDASRPVVAGARLGRDPDGRPAWYVPDPDAPGRYLEVG